MYFYELTAANMFVIFTKTSFIILKVRAQNEVGAGSYGPLVRFRTKSSSIASTEENRILPGGSKYDQNVLQGEADKMNSLKNYDHLVPAVVVGSSITFIFLATAMFCYRRKRQVDSSKLKKYPTYDNSTGEYIFCLGL